MFLFLAILDLLALLIFTMILSSKIRRFRIPYQDCCDFFTGRTQTEKWVETQETLGTIKPQPLPTVGMGRNQCLLKRL